MRTVIFAAVALFALVVSTSAEPSAVYFAPGGEPREAIVKELKDAKSQIHVAAYDLTSKEIAEALVNAFHREVKVEVILDHGTAPSSQADFLSKRVAGV